MLLRSLKSHLSLVCAGLLACAASFGASSITRQDGARLLKDMPLRFEQNAGQMEAGIQFRTKIAGSPVVVLPTGLRFSDRTRQGRELELQLLGANPDAHLDGLGALSVQTSYIKGPKATDWVKGVRQFSRVRASEVYPGVDAVYYGNGQQLEYDFLLKPGADPAQIKIRFDKQAAVQVNDRGDLAVSQDGQVLLQRRPFAYQFDPRTGERVQVTCAYRLSEGNIASLDLGPYDRNRELVVDPELLYSTLLGGSGVETIISVAVDNDGIVYVAGNTGTQDFSGTDGVYQQSTKGDQDVFIARIDPSKPNGDSLVAFTFLGGTAADTVSRMILAPDGNLYLVGYTASGDFPMAGSSVQTTLSGTLDAWVACLDRTLLGQYALSYSTLIGGSANDMAYGIAVDANRSMYVIGTTNSTDFPLSGDALQPASGGGRDTFLVKLDPGSGTSVYSTYFGGDSTDEGRDVVVTAPNQVYLTGWTSSGNFPIAGNAFQAQYRGAGDVYIAQFNLSTSGLSGLVYATYLGGGDLDQPRRMVVDSQGRLLITGYSLSRDFPVSANTFQPSLGGESDAFVVRFDPRQAFTNALSYSSYLGGIDGDVAYDIQAGTGDMVYVSGYTLSTNFPTTPNGLQPLYGGGFNAFVTALNLANASSGALSYSTYIGSTNVSVAYSVATRPGKPLYIAGYTQEQSFLVTGNAYQKSPGNFAGGGDGFITVVDLSKP
jgi:hypothetical protein